MCSRTSAHYIHGAGCRWSELQVLAHMSLEYIKRVRISNCLWKSIPGWNGPRKKRILKCVNRRLETLELSGMTSCWVLRTWYMYRMVLLWVYIRSPSFHLYHPLSSIFHPFSSHSFPLPSIPFVFSKIHFEVCRMLWNVFCWKMYFGAFCKKVKKRICQ